jgi:hypothetical protein
MVVVPFPMLDTLDYRMMRSVFIPFGDAVAFASSDGQGHYRSRSLFLGDRRSGL